MTELLPMKGYPLTLRNCFRFLPCLPGDDTYCKWFRNTSDYLRADRFVNILDTAVMDYLLLSYDSKDNYIVNEKKQKVNVMIDRGKA